MKIILIRHGDPDYSIDSLTDTGKKEAKLLGGYLKDKIDKDSTYIYISPLGRAQDTAKYTLDATGMQGKTLDWLAEFVPPIIRPDSTCETVPWDWLPADWTREENFFSDQNWTDNENMKTGPTAELHQRVTSEFDNLLESHGYVRKGRYYEVTNSNHDTLVFFCHFGTGGVLLSHLIGMSPMVLWHGFCASPSSITTIYTEERQKGIAFFRCLEYGAVPHLTLAGEDYSFSGRFCECFADDTRH